MCGIVTGVQAQCSIAFLNYNMLDAREREDFVCVVASYI